MSSVFTSEGVTFQGKTYADWPSLRAALEKAGVNRTQWVRNHPGAARSLGVGIGEGGNKVVKLTSATQGVAEPATPAADEPTDEELRTNFYVNTRRDLLDLGITDQRFIDDIIARGINTQDVDSVLFAAFSDPRIDQFLPGFTALADAGLVSADGTGYRAFRNQANSIYRNFLGRDITDGELADIGHNNLTLGFLESFFTFRRSFVEGVEQFQGRKPTETEVAQAFNTGRPVERIIAGFQAEAITGAESGDIQRAAQRTGTRFSEEELRAFGEAKAGIGDEFGLGVLSRVEEVFDRANRIFQGQLARGSLALPARRRRESADVGA